MLVSTVDIIPYPLDFVFLKDEQFHGEQYQLKFGLFDRDLNFDKDYKLRGTITVKSVHKDLYDYYRSISLFKLNSGNVLAEPEQIFSNIENGVGILGSYTEQSFVIDLPTSGFWYSGDLTIENDGCSAPCTVKFSAEMGDKVNPVWDFWDGTTSTEKNPEHTYKESGDYNISLNVSLGDEGYSSSTEIFIN